MNGLRAFCGVPLQPDRMQGRLSEGWQGKQGKLSRGKPEFVAILTSLSTCRAAREGFYDRLKILTMIYAHSQEH